MTRLYLKGHGKPRRLIATLNSEALMLFSDRLRELQRSARFNDTYEIEEDPIKVGKVASLQVDLSEARPTQRTISVEFNYHLKDNKRHYTVYHPTAGTVRAVVDDSPAGANKVFSRIRTVWPNVQLPLT